MSDRPFTSESFYQFLGERKLMGSRCTACDALYVPPRPLCPKCFGEEMAWVEMKGDGRLVAFTTVHIAPTAMIEAGYGRNNPYCAGVVALDEGPAISAQILGVDESQPEEIVLGTPLQVAFVERGGGDDQQTYLAFST